MKLEIEAARTDEVKSDQTEPKKVNHSVCLWAALGGAMLGVLHRVAAANAVASARDKSHKTKHDKPVT